MRAAGVTYTASMKRRPPPFAVIVAIAAFILAQLMGAVHACDMGTRQAPAKAAAVAHDGGDCCDHGQTAPDPNCDNHCQQAFKAPERVQASVVASVVAAAVALPAVRTSRSAPRASALPAPHLARHTEPPISIRNCCFRI